MSLDSAGKAMIAQQVKHHHDGLDADHQYKVHSWFLFKDSGWLTLDANDEYEAGK